MGLAPGHAMTCKYEFTRLLVSNFRECFRFYRDVTGFRVIFGEAAGSYADFDAGPVNIALFDRHEMSAAVGTLHLPAQVDAQDKVCLVFAVEDVDGVCAQLKARGVQPVLEPADHPDWGIRTACFRDPDGTLIEINQPVKKADSP
jgi:catechol 2,3-dioxygenase-like lactoylglutathione lyase family enzyme